MSKPLVLPPNLVQAAQSEGRQPWLTTGRPEPEQDTVIAALLFRELPATAPTRVLLCTDLHAGNVLAAARESWLVIDPKPHVGDPAGRGTNSGVSVPAKPAGSGRMKQGPLHV